MAKMHLDGYTDEQHLWWYSEHHYIESLYKNTTSKVFITVRSTTLSKPNSESFNDACYMPNFIRCFSKQCDRITRRKANRCDGRRYDREDLPMIST